MNKVFLIGNLTTDPQLFQTREGKLTAKVSIAVNRIYGEGADFFEVAFWGKPAEFIEEYIYKGYKVAIIGRIENNNYVDQNGVKHYALRIQGEQIELVSMPHKETPSVQDAQPVSNVSEVKSPTQQHIDEFLQRQEEELPF